MVSLPVETSANSQWRN